MTRSVLVDGYTVDRPRPRGARAFNPDDGRHGAAAPDRSLAQRMDALAKGNGYRTYRKNIKADLKARRITIVEVLKLDPIPAELATAKVFDLLLATPKIGRVKANKVLQVVRISPSKTLAGMSDRQRAELVSMLRR